MCTVIWQTSIHRIEGKVIASELTLQDNLRFTVTFKYVPSRIYSQDSNPIPRLQAIILLADNFVYIVQITSPA